MERAGGKGEALTALRDPVCLKCQWLEVVVAQAWLTGNLVFSREPAFFSIGVRFPDPS